GDVGDAVGDGHVGLHPAGLSRVESVWRLQLKLALEGQLVVLVVSVVDANRGLPEQSAAGRVEREHVSSLARRQNDRTPRHGGEDRRYLQVPVVEVVGESLVVPLQSARGLAQLYQAIGVQLAAWRRLGLLL